MFPGSSFGHRRIWLVARGKQAQVSQHPLHQSLNHESREVPNRKMPLCLTSSSLPCEVRERVRIPPRAKPSDSMLLSSMARRSDWRTSRSIGDSPRLGANIHGGVEGVTSYPLILSRPVILRVSSHRRSRCLTRLDATHLMSSLSVCRGEILSSWTSVSSRCVVEVCLHLTASRDDRLSTNTLGPRPWRKLYAYARLIPCPSC